MKKIIPILQRICINKQDEFYQDVDDVIEHQDKKFIVTANPEIVMMGRRNEDMYNLLMDNAIEIIPDGIGLVKSLRLMYRNKEIKRNTGIELVQHILEVANEKEKSIFIYGAKEIVLADFLKMCKVKYPNIIFEGCYNGYSNCEEDVLNIIETCNADIYLAALGTPRQELFLYKFFRLKQKGLFVGIGGSLDVLSGQNKRAPKFFLNHNLEWLYRITKEPKRIKRFLKSNICYIFVFFWNYLKWKLFIILFSRESDKRCSEWKKE